MRRRRRRHHRSWFRQLRQSLRGIGVTLILALVVAVAVVWAILPAAETTFSTIMSIPDAMSIANMEKKAKAR